MTDNIPVPGEAATAIEDAPAPIGHNEPPAFDPEKVEASEKQATAFMEAGAKWVALGEIKTEADAGLLVDFIAGIRAAKSKVEKQRRAEKKVHDDRGKEVQNAFLPVLDKYDLAARKVIPLQTAWLAKMEAKRREEIAKKEAEAEAVRIEAENSLALAQAQGNIAAEAEAEAAVKAADKADKAVTRLAKAPVKVASVTGGARSMSNRGQRSAKVINLRALFFHYADHPDVEATLVRLANADIRAKGIDETKIPGIEIVIAETTV